MASDEAEQVRQRGNALYKDQKLTDALVAYERAAELASESVAPQTNLSATHFELGDYEKAIVCCDSALALASEKATRQKLQLRKAKCRVLLKDVDNARTALEGTEPSGEVADISACIRQNAAVKARSRDERSALARIVLDLPRYKPAIRNVPVYFQFGHDEPESVVDTDLLVNSEHRLSLLFAGIGDARNLFATLILLGAAEKKGVAPARKLYHMTIVDIKPAVIARNLLLFIMLDRLRSMKHAREIYSSDYLRLLYYTYMAPIMPSKLYRLLQQTIQEALAMIDESMALPSFVEVPKLYRVDVARVLKQWQGDAAREYPTQAMREGTVREGARSAAIYEMFFGNSQATQKANGFAKQDAFYRHTGILLMSSAQDDSVLQDDPELRRAWGAFDERRPQRLDTAFLGSVDRAWKSNVTIIDLDYMRNRDSDVKDIGINHDPFQFGSVLQKQGFDPPRRSAGPQDGLFEYISFWFVCLLDGMRECAGRLTVEACIGDVSAVMEQIRYGVVGHRLQSEAGVAPNDTSHDTSMPANLGRALDTQQGRVRDSELETYPQLYDRIHLSNIPDYVGGSLTTFMYALPILRPGNAQYITANCLRNTRAFKTAAHFNNEYITLSAPTDLEKTFHVRMEALEADNPMALADYAKWHHCYRSRTLAELLPRHTLETWLYRLFFKHAIPAKRHSDDGMHIYSPLNLTSFIRLCSHLHSIGYPAHWLSGVMGNLLSGKIVTTARPPKSMPLRIREVKEARQRLQQSVQPFVAELSTLVSIWQPVLPFGIQSDNIPLPDALRKFEVTMNTMLDENGCKTAMFILVFLDKNLNASHLGHKLTDYLISDETSAHSEPLEKVRESGLHVVTVWEWNGSKMRASFWLRQDVMESMRQGNWTVAIWRTDYWVAQSEARSVSQVRALPQPW